MNSVFATLLNCGSMSRNGILLVVLLAPLTVVGQTLTEQFLKDAPSALKEYYRKFPAEFSCRLKCQNRIKKSAGGEDNIIGNSEAGYFKKGRMRIYEVSLVKNGQAIPFVAFGVNDRYFFRVRYDQGKWSLTQLSFEIDPFPFDVMKFAERGFAIIPYQTPLDALYANDPGLSVLDAIPQIVGGREVVKVKFGCNFEEGSRIIIDGNPIIMGATRALSIVFDPENNWLPISGSLQLGPAKTGTSEPTHNHEITWEYAKTDGVTHCVRIQTLDNWSGDGDSGSGGSYWDDIKYDFSSVPGSRFYLTHYGIAEPPGSRRWWVWILGIAVGVGLVVLVVLKLVKNPQAASS